MPTSHEARHPAAELEIRVHGRGGQGGVTCAKILAVLYARRGKAVQTFGDYAGERSGAPVRAYTRVGDGPITNRNKVYAPDHLIVLDPSLLKGDVVSGLKDGGTLLLNSPRPPEAFGDQFTAFELATVDATDIARRHGIGTRSVVIVNTSIVGAFARTHGFTLPEVEAAYEALGLSRNFPAAEEAYRDVHMRAPSATSPRATKAPATATLPPVEALIDHQASGPTGLKTGSWSAQRPLYVEKVAPCNAWCPAGNDVVGFVQTLKQDGVEAAAAILARTTPLPGVCGRVCPAPCMDGCNRAEYDGAVNIRGLERFVADHARVATTPAQTDDPRRLAVVGGGPTGLAAAFELARLGHRVTLYERHDHLGGLLRTEIPRSLLPLAVLDQEIAALQALGVEMRTGEEVCDDRLRALAADFDAVILAIPGDRAIHDARRGAAALPENVFRTGTRWDDDDSVAHAIGVGRHTAGVALRSLGVLTEVFERPDRADAISIAEIGLDHFPRVEPARERVAGDPATLAADQEIGLGLADAAEAGRCFSCGHCTRCDTCLVYCPEGIIRRTPKGYAVNFGFCKGCGVCVEECPRGAMEMRET